MKVAVISDVHANYVALQAVTAHLDAWKPDAVIVAGDLVNRGPRPAECLRFVQERQQVQGWLVLRGNHEDYVISRGSPLAPLSGPAYEVHRATLWTYQKIGCDVSSLQALPFQISLATPGGELRVVHASMRGNRIGIYPETRDEELGPLIGEPGFYPAAFCVGHTHRPLIRRLGNSLVVNAGSAGLPFDGDLHPSYAQLIYTKGKWLAHIMRVDYDHAQAVQDFFDSGYAPQAGPLVDLVLVELREARSQLYGWAINYQAAAQAGKISMAESVRLFRASSL